MCAFFGGYQGNGGGDAITDRGYTGHEQNDDLGLIYMNARYYAPYIYHFQSRDPFPGSARTPASQNGYSYVHGNPVNYTDPHGLCIVGHDGTVRPNQYPYGTSGICPNTMTPDGELRSGYECPASMNLANCIYNGNIGRSRIPSPAFNPPFFLTEETFDKYTPDALVLGTSGSVTLNLIGPIKKLIPLPSKLDTLGFSGICGLDLLISLNEWPSIFLYYGGGSKGGITDIEKSFGLSANGTPIGAGAVWELNGHENYTGLYETLSIDGSAVVGGEANLFRSPEAIPFYDRQPGSWGFTVAPNAGGGLSVAVTQTCFVEITTIEFWQRMATGDFEVLYAHCKR